MSERRGSDGGEGDLAQRDLTRRPQQQPEGGEHDCEADARGVLVDVGGVDDEGDRDGERDSSQRTDGQDGRREGDGGSHLSVGIRPAQQQLRPRHQEERGNEDQERDLRVELGQDQVGLPRAACCPSRSW